MCLKCKLKDVEEELRVKNNRIAELESLVKLKEENGIQIVKLPGIEDFEAAFEDIPSAGPKWMVIQRRIDGTVSFNTLNFMHKYWYKQGFGNLEREFWFGCQKLHELTTSRRHELYIQIADFDGATAYARYDNFVIGSENEGYTLRSLGAYSGDAGDALSASVNKKFKHNGCYYGCYNREFCWSWWANSQW